MFGGDYVRRNRSVCESFYGTLTETEVSILRSYMCAVVVLWVVFGS